MTARVALALVLAAACGGAGEKPVPTTTHPSPGSGSARDTATAPVDPGPPPPRDCSLLAPAINRIFTAEIADIRKNRPPEVAPIAQDEAETTRALLVDVLPARCDADHWSGAYTACVDAAQTLDDARACQIHLSTDQQASLDEAIKNRIPPGGTLGIPECDQWEQLGNKLASCDKFPADSRAAVVEGIKQTMASWRSQPMTSDMARSIQAACKAAVSSMTDSIKSLGCAL